MLKQEDIHNGTTPEAARYRREHPHIEENMLVNIFDEGVGYRWLTMGVVVEGSRRWNEFSGHYIVDVRVGDAVWCGILANRLERAVLNGSLRRELFRSV